MTLYIYIYIGAVAGFLKGRGSNLGLHATGGAAWDQLLKSLHRGPKGGPDPRPPPGSATGPRLYNIPILWFMLVLCFSFPLFNSRVLFAGKPARVYMWTAERLEFEGADVQLFCRADGHPAPTITWYDRRGAVIGSNEEQYIVRSS